MFGNLSVSGAVKVFFLPKWSFWGLRRMKSYDIALFLFWFTMVNWCPINLHKDCPAYLMWNSEGHYRINDDLQWWYKWWLEEEYVKVLLILLKHCLEPGMVLLMWGQSIHLDFFFAGHGFHVSVLSYFLLLCKNLLQVGWLRINSPFSQPSLKVSPFSLMWEACLL